MPALPATALRQKVRRLTVLFLWLWLLVTLVPIWLARSGLTWGAWPIDFWMAAQGSVLFYLLLVALYAWLVNRWERQAGQLSFDVPPDQDV